MGRELKRVPLDFDWPLDKRWGGFLNPYHKACMWCAGRGNTKLAQGFEDFCRRLSVLAGDIASRQADFVPQPPLKPSWYEPIDDSPCRWPWPKLDFISTLKKSANWEEEISEKDQTRLLNLAHFWHDPRKVPRYGSQVINRMNYPHPYLGEDGIDDPGTTLGPFLKALKAVPQFGSDYKTWFLLLEFVHGKKTYKHKDYKAWANCKACKGRGRDQKFRKGYKSWEPTPVPEGPGYQLWETVTEGSPVSPVFPTPEAFVEYLISEGRSRQAAESFLESGWAPSMMISGGKFYKGIDAHEVLGKD